jgi:hypothetical protein
MALFMAFNLWIGPGFIFYCYSVINKCIHFVRIRITQTSTFLISNFRCVLNVVCFLLGNSPGVQIICANVSEHSVCSVFIGAYEDGTECSETLAYKIRTLGNYPEESIQQTPTCFGPYRPIIGECTVV